jgi:outer membrane protein assembly factor BamB
VWPAPPGAGLGVPAADAEGVVITYGRRRVVALSDDGRVRWDVERVGVTPARPATGDGLVVVGTDDGVLALDRRTGSTRWDAALGDRSTPVLGDGLVLATLWENGLVALRAGDGGVAWQRPLPGAALGPPAIGDGRAVAAWQAPDGTSGVTCVTLAEGRPCWQVELPGELGAPAVVRGVVAIVAGDLAVHGIDLVTGRPRWRVEVGGAGAPEVPAVGDGTRVVVATRDAALCAVAARRGRVLWCTPPAGAADQGAPAGPGPGGRWALAEASGRLAVRRPTRGPTPGQGAPFVQAVAAVAVSPSGLLLVARRAVTADERPTLSAWREW